MKPIRVVANDLAKEFAPDLIRKPSKRNFLFESKPYLLPALDYRDGVVYLTLPATYMSRKRVGRGKESYFIDHEATGTMCVTSERHSFSYDQESVQELGYRFPPTFVQQSDESRWRLQSVQEFLAGRQQAPDPALLYGRIKTVYETYVEYADPRHYSLMALFVMATYVFRAFKAMAYIHFSGSRGSGKSRNIKILEAIA